MTSVRCSRSILLCNFYSHAPYGTWLPDSENGVNPLLFLLTRPLRDVTRGRLARLVITNRFLLTRPLRDVTCSSVLACGSSSISTHTPLTGRDRIPWWYTDHKTISTHTPLTGRDAREFGLPQARENFYSHAPYGTWQFFVTLTFDRSNFYSHAPYGTWRGYYMFIDLEFNFYSHAPYGTWRKSFKPKL